MDGEGGGGECVGIGASGVDGGMTGYSDFVLLLQGGYCTPQDFWLAAPPLTEFGDRGRSISSNLMSFEHGGDDVCFQH